MGRGYPALVAQRGPTITFYGVRGSVPCDGPRYSRYGGNTSSVVLEADGHDPVIFDLGTGVRTYGDVVAQQVTERAGLAVAPYRADVLLTHLHWDHVIGLPFFAPVSWPDARVVVHGPRQDEGPLRRVFAGVMRPPYFPITPADLSGEVGFVDLGDDEFGCDGIKVTSRWVRHTDPALGFRVELEGISVTDISDHGPGCVPDDPPDYVPDAVLELCDGVDVLIHDAQHTAAEFAAKPHFGHSSIDYALHVADEAAVKRLVLFHHCPSHGDDEVDRILRDAQDAAAGRGGFDVVAAYEGLRLELGGVTADRDTLVDEHRGLRA